MYLFFTLICFLIVDIVFLVRFTELLRMVLRVKSQCPLESMQIYSNVYIAVLCLL